MTDTIDVQPLVRILLELLAKFEPEAEISLALRSYEGEGKAGSIELTSQTRVISYQIEKSEIIDVEEWRQV
jgi:hypothetical protein